MSASVFICPVTAETARTALARGLLSPTERARAERLRLPAARARYITSRTLLRATLAAHLGCAPAAIEWAVGAQGKPFLAHRQDCHFNLAHSRERVVVAISDQAPVGIDVEARGRPCRADALARQYFQPAEQAWLQAAPPALRRYRFFQLWTLKEAITKALGRGLWGTLTGIRLSALDSGQPRLELADGAACATPFVWAHYDLGDDYSLAFARQNDDPTPPRLFDATPAGTAITRALSPDLAGRYSPPTG